jgi:hypothetical protein
VDDVELWRGLGQRLLDAGGRLVAKEEARTVAISEYDIEDRWLAETVGSSERDA